MSDAWDAREHLERGGVAVPEGAELGITGLDPVLASRHRAGEAAACAAAAAAAWAARVGERRGLPSQPVQVDVRAAAATLLGFLLQSSSEPIDLVRTFSPVTDLFRTADDRRIHLHGGFEHLERGTVALLGCDLDADAIAAAVAGWEASALEDALAAAGLCGAVVRSREEWRAHEQGRAVVDLPAVRLRRLGDAEPRGLDPAPRPLAGVRVVDLTRVLAGPTTGRTLAAHGAEVLRVDAPHLPTVEVFDVETGRGKRRTWCDLRDADDRRALLALVDEADVVVHSYRQDALDRFGLGVDDLAARNPRLVLARVCCYGPDGPWATRRGWEQLAQSTSGIAHAEDPADPHLIPAAATDYTTGYLAASGITEALWRQATEGGTWLVDASLCQTAEWLQRLGADLDPTGAVGLGDVAARQTTTASPWGELTQLAPIEQLPVTPPRWDRPPARPGSSPLRW